MLLSAKRTIIATCAVALCVLLLCFKVLVSQYPTTPVIIPTATGGNSSGKAFGGLNPHWTTEQMEPRFAYVQYATDFDYLCNAVSITRAEYVVSPAEIFR